MNKYKNISDQYELSLRREYSKKIDNFSVLKKWINDAIGQKIIHNENLYTHKVRIKTIESLLKKLDDKIEKEIRMIEKGKLRKEDSKWMNVNGFEELVYLVDDLVGARIITYVNSNLSDLHNEIMKSTVFFKVTEVTIHQFDERSTIPLNEKTDVNENIRINYNGYVGVHYIISPITIDNCWNEKPYIFEKFELQIRSLLQETWGEIQHSVIYKGRIPEVKKMEHNEQFAEAAELLLSMDKMLSRLANKK